MTIFYKIYNRMFESSRSTAICVQWDKGVSKAKDRIFTELSTYDDLRAFGVMLSYLKWVSRGDLVGNNDGDAFMTRIEVNLLDRNNRIYEIKTPPFRTYYRVATITTEGRKPFKVFYIVRFLRKDSQKAHKSDIDGAINTWKKWRDTMKSLGKRVESAQNESSTSKRTLNEIVRSDPHFWDKHLDKCYTLLRKTHDDSSLVEYFREVLNNAPEE